MEALSRAVIYFVNHLHFGCSFGIPKVGGGGSRFPSLFSRIRLLTLDFLLSTFDTFLNIWEKVNKTYLFYMAINEPTMITGESLHVRTCE